MAASVSKCLRSRILESSPNSPYDEALQKRFSDGVIFKKDTFSLF